MGAFTELIADNHARECAQVLAESWDIWRGDCPTCDRVGAFGFLDRCAECAVECVYLNEMEYGGTTEYVHIHLDIDSESGRCVRLIDLIAEKTLEHQANIWRNLARLNGQGVTA